MNWQISVVHYLFILSGKRVYASQVGKWYVAEYWKPFHRGRSDNTRYHSHCIVELSVNSMNMRAVSHTGAQYSAAEKTRLRAEERKLDPDEPHVVPQSFYMILFRIFNFSAVFVKCSLNESVLSSVTLSILAFCCV